MLYLSGAIRPELRHDQLGWMFSPRMGNRVPGHGWYAIDNGCFGDPLGFSMERFERFVARITEQAPARCLFVVAPDIPFDADGTVARFDEYLPAMKQFGRPIAMVTQDGMQPEDIRWNDVDALFVGGSTEWKLGSESAAIIAEAKRRGLWVHVGRVNSARRFRAARAIGADSVDGTFMKYGGVGNEAQVLRWLNDQTTAAYAVGKELV